MVTEIDKPIGWTAIWKEDGEVARSRVGEAARLYESEGTAKSAISRSYLNEEYLDGEIEIVPVYL